METTETVTPSNIELEEKKDDNLPVNKEKKRSVSLENKIQSFLLFFFVALQKSYQVNLINYSL